MERSKRSYKRNRKLIESQSAHNMIRVQTYRQKTWIQDLISNLFNRTKNQHESKKDVES